ncbi:MAG: MFS transporter, partial [Micrococcales bacterium]|nr:MFS transporter [Micrococcales bacterium]
MSNSAVGSDVPDGCVDTLPEENVSRLSVLMLSRAGQIGVMVALCTGVVGAAFEMYGIQASMPGISHDLDPQRTLYVWPVTMFLVGQVFSIIVSGRLIDRFGAFKPLAVGVTLFIIGLTLAGSSTTMIMFLAARVTQGLGGGAMNIAVMVVIAEIYPDQRRSFMMTIFSFCYLGPAFVGPMLAARITVTIGWRYMFWLIIPFLLMAGAVGTRPMQQLYRQRPKRGSSPGEVPIWAAVAGTIGMACLQAATQSIEHITWTIVPLALVGLVAVGAAMHTMMPTGFWTFRSGMASLMWVRLTLAGAFLASYSLLSLMLTEDRGYTLEQASWALAVGAVGWASGTVLQSRPELKLRRDQIIVIGSIFEGCAIVIMAMFAFWRALPMGVAI